MVDLEIHWTNGGVEKVNRLHSNRLFVIKEGHGVVHSETWQHEMKS